MSPKQVSLWCFVLIGLYIPNLGFERPTPFGTLTVADYIIGPYLLLVYHAGRNVSISRLNIGSLMLLLVLFLWWALTATMIIPLQYGYDTNYQLQFGLLKLGKLSLYALASVLTSRALSRQEYWQPYYWSVLAAGVMVGITLIISGNSPDALGVTESAFRQVYQDNPTSAMMAILIAFVAGSILTAQGSMRWRRWAMTGLVLMILGFLTANGRGGWLAAIVSAIYLVSHVNLKRTFFATLFGAALLIFAYNQYPDFKYQVDRTLQPDQGYLERYNMGVAGFDDGARWITLANEAPKLLDSPLFGRGFFHRGGQSGLFSTGSHNFFLQMFLETGVPGGILILSIFWRMWRQAGAQVALDQKLKLPVRAAFIAAFVVSLSGEYFYGGMVLFTLFLAYAPVGSLVNASATASTQGKSFLKKRKHSVVIPRSHVRASSSIE